MIVKNTQHIIFKYQFTFSDKGCKSCRGVQKARSKSNRHTEKTYEKTQLLTDIHSRMVECENGFLQEVQLKRDKVEKEKTTAEEMRKKACEKLGETKKRQELEDTSGPGRKRKSTEFLEYLKYKQDTNKENTEKQLKIREQEIMLEKQ